MHARGTGGPLRTSTPTPTALESSPLRLPPSPRLVSLAVDPTSSSLSSSSSTSALVPPSPVPSKSTLRSRRSASPLPDADPASAHFGSSSAASSRPPSPRGSPRLQIDADVTRPSLRQATNDALGVAALGRPGGTPSPGGGPADGNDADGYILRGDPKGKGKAREYADAGARRGASENGVATKEREVIVHKVRRTDSYASISLQYGITPQALRASNRLWPSDPIYLRSTLLIPLDQCNLPSSSFGVERIAREENGDLTVWDRNGAAHAHEGLREGLGSAAAREEREGDLLRPRARRVAAASALEAVTPPVLDPPIDLLGDDANEFHSVWSDGGTPSARESLDVARPPMSPEMYLMRMRGAEALSRTGSPSTAAGSSSFSPAPSASSRATSPPAPYPGTSSSPSFDGTPTGTSTPPTLAKRTLRVARLPASQLAFFPPSSSSGPSSPAKPPRGTGTGAGTDHGAVAARGAGVADESLFFGPLTNSLSASFSSLSLGIGLNRYLPSSLAPSGQGQGRIALPPSPGAASQPRRRASRWALLDFGVEEDEAEAAAAHPRPGSGASASREDYFALAAGAGAAGGSRVAAGGGGGGAETSMVGGLGYGLEDAGSWPSSNRRRGGPGPPPIPPPSRGGSAAPSRKARDSNEVR